MKTGITRVRIIGDGFNPDKIGFYAGQDNQGNMIINVDPYNLLPKDSEHKTITIHPKDNFEVL